MNRAHDPTLEVPIAHAFAHVTFLDSGAGPKWERIFDRELTLELGDVVGLALTSDSEEQIRSEPETHYIVTHVERVMRLHDGGDTLVQFITLEECAPPMQAEDAPVT